MILNTYHTPISIVQRLPNDAYSNCILIFSASFFPGNWPIMKRHCSSLRFGRPANQLVLIYRSPPQNPQKQTTFDIDWMFVRFGGFNPFQRKTDQIGSSNPKFQGEKNEPKHVWKNPWWKGSPHLAKKHHETTFQAFLAFSWICLLKVLGKVTTIFRWFFMESVMRSEVPQHHSSRSKSKRNGRRFAWWWVAAGERPRTGDRVFFLVPEKEGVFFPYNTWMGRKGQHKLTRVVFAFVWKQGFQKWDMQIFTTFLLWGGKDLQTFNDALLLMATSQKYMPENQACELLQFQKESIVF